MTQNNKGPLIIGLTGSIATGKSALTSILKELGYYIIDSDKIARRVSEKKEVLDQIEKEFGKEAIKDGQINREYLGKKVFGNEENLKKINRIIHPKVYEEIIKSIIPGINFLDIPLLFETYEEGKSYGLKFNEIWLAYTPEEIQIKRLMNRDKIDKDFAIKKISSQMSIEKKKGLSDLIIDNSGSLEDLREKVKKIVKQKEKEYENFYKKTQI